MNELECTQATVFAKAVELTESMAAFNRPDPLTAAPLSQLVNEITQLNKEIAYRNLFAALRAWIDAAY